MQTHLKGFMVFEIPSSTLAQRFPLAKYLGVNIVLWATFLILHAASANFGFFFAMRFLLGTFECCVSPSEPYETLEMACAPA
jgi:ACS family allantoate permease-like MFS transporter